MDEHGLYVALPDAREIQIYLTSQGGLCVMDQALHPVETVEWCVYALFIQDEQRIKRDCSMNFKPRKANPAQSMGGYLWAVSSLVGEKMQVRCLTETHVEVIKPPLQVIHIGNGCEGSEAQEIKRMLLTLLEILAGQHCPPPLPLRPTRLAITPAETTPA